MNASMVYLRRVFFYSMLAILCGVAAVHTAVATPLLTYELRPTADAVRWHGPDGVSLMLSATSAPATLTYDPTSRELWLSSAGLLDVKGLITPGTAVLRAPIVRLHDAPTTPLHVRVGGDLTIHAQTIDLFALQHPASWLRSGGDMILRSPHPIVGDAHYSAGGNFQLEDENGRPADLLSPHDPIVLASGNVSFGAYTGASLHVVAGGSITAGGAINITGADTAANTIHPANAATFNGTNTLLQLAVIPLSNGQVVAVRGNIRPTLDLRAGIDWTTFTGGAPADGVVGAGIAPVYAAATTADITTQNITISDLNGLVVLSNQYRPNGALTGNITTGLISTTGNSSGFWAGDVNLDSKGNLTTGNINTTVNSPNFADDGGDVRLLAQGTAAIGNISTGTQVTTANSVSGNGGNVLIRAGGNLQAANIDTAGVATSGGILGTSGNIHLTSTGGNATFNTLDTGIAGGGPYTTDKTGDITVLAPNGTVTSNATQMWTRNECTGNAACDVGQGGDIFISASTGINLPINFTLGTTSNSSGAVHGRSGDITLLTGQGDIIHTGSIWVRNEATFGSVFGAGNVTYATGQGSVRIGNLEGFARTPDGDVLENNGNLTITATTGITVANVSTYAQNEANNTPYTTVNGGNISLYTSNGPIFVSALLNAISDGDAGSGNGGQINLTAPNGAITIGNNILTYANATTAAGQAGEGGDVFITAGGNIQTASIDTSGGVGASGTFGSTGDISLTSTGGNATFNTLDTGIVGGGPYTTDKTGDITVLTPNGNVTVNSTQLWTRNECGNAACDVGQGGDIFISASTGINLPINFTLGTTSNSSGAVHGRSGDITLLTGQGDIIHTGSIWVRNEATFGSVFRAGNVTYATGQGSVRIGNLEGFARTPDGDVLENNGSLTITATTGITVANVNAYAQNEASNTPYTTQNGGNITLYTSDGAIVSSSGLNASSDGDAGSGNGGQITLTAPNGAITVGNNMLTNANATTAAGQAGAGGNVTITANGNIQTANIDTAGGVGAGGTLGATGDISLTSTGGNAAFGTLDTALSSGSPYTSAQTGDITVWVPNGSVTLNSTLMRTHNDCFNIACHVGQAGDIYISAATALNLPAGFGISTSSNSNGQSSGRGGNVTFLTDQGDISFTGNLWTVNYAGVGDTTGGGHVTFATGQGSVTLNFAETIARTPDGDTGNGGNIVITATTGITVTNRLFSYAQNNGSNTPATTQNGGDISLYTSNGPLSIGNNGVNASSDGDAASGRGGRVTLTAPNGAITIGNNILTNANATTAAGQAGAGGDVTITANGNIQTTSIDTGGGVGVAGSIGRSGDITLHSETGNITFANLLADLGSQATHAGTGSITVTAPNGQVTATGTTLRTMIFNGNAAVSNTADAGAITLEADTGINLPANFQIMSMVNVGNTSTGRGGDVRLVTNQGDINFAFIWANTTTGQGGAFPGSGSVHIETGNGSVQLTDGWGVTNYAITTNNGGQTTAATGSVHITATTGITIAGQVQNFATLGAGGTGAAGTGDISLYTSNGPIQVNGNLRTDSNGRTTTGPTGDITLQAPNGAITIGGTTAPDANASDAGGQAAESGNITLLARDNIQTGNLDTGGNGIGTGGSVGRTGSVFAESQLGNITVTNIWTDMAAVATHAGTGDIHLRALNGQVTFLNTNLATIIANGNPAAFNTADAGDVIIEAGTGIIFPPNLNIRTMVNVGGTSTGRGGDVRLTTAQGDISFAFIWANTTTGQGGTFPGSGSVHIETGNGSVQLTDGWGVTNYAITTNNGQTTAATGSVHITATTGITIAGQVQNFATLGVGGTGAAGTGDISLFTTNGPIQVNGNLRTDSNGRTTTGPTGDITLTAVNGPATVGGSLTTVGQASDNNGQAAASGAITVNAQGAIQTGNLSSNGTVGAGGTKGNGGSIALTSNTANVTFGTIATGFLHNTPATTGDAGNVILLAPQGSLNTASGAIFAYNEGLNAGSQTGRGGDITLTAATGINTPANFNLYAENYSNNTANGRAGDIQLHTDQGNITLNSVWAHNRAAVGNVLGGGTIDISTGNGSIQISAGSFGLESYANSVTGNATGDAGTITLTATQGITVTGLTQAYASAAGTATHGGDVYVTTSNGPISMGRIETQLVAGSTGWSAGDIRLNAPNGSITTTNLLNASATTAANTPSQAGHIALTSSGNIQTQNVQASAPNGPAQQGGTIELTSGQMVRALGSITADGVASAITITHGGGGVIPFIVGDAATNGSTGALTTADAQIVPTNSYLYTHHETPNIWIISVDGPNLALSKQVTPALIDQGGTVTYTVVLTNSGPTAANGLVLTDMLPPEVIFGSWLAQPAGAVQAGQNITWTGNLAVSSAVTLQFTAVHIGNYGDVVTNTASYYLIAQPSLNNTASATFTVSGPPNVSVDKSVSATSPALPGQPISYTISVANESATAVARNVIITDTIPAQLIGASVSASGLTILNTTGSYVWELADLAPNQSGTIVVSGFINPAVSADVTFTNTATLSADGDPDPADNSASVALTVQLPRVQLGTAATAVGEPNSPALLNVTLDRAQPYRPVTVTATTSDGTANAGSDYTAITQTVVFAPNQTTAVVAIPILDDTVQEGSEDFNLTLSAPAGAILAAPTSATITIVDNDDTTGVLITPALLAVAEGGATDSYEVRLGSAPTDTVTITLAPDSQLTTSAAVLTFTAANWSNPQVVTVTAVDDAISEGNHLGFIQHSVASNDPAYNGLLAATVIAAIADNETAGIVLTPLTGNVAEGGATTSYTITLQAEPTAPVTITITPDGQVTTSVTELVFTAANWATPQLVTVTAVDDTVAEGNHVGFVAHSVASGDPNYEAAPLGAFIANIADNDGAAVSIAPTNLAVAEGGVTASYAISLTSEPTADVYVNISPDGQLTTDMAVLTFTAANWDTPQTVQVTAVDDAVAEGNHVGVVQHTTASSDPTFDGLPAASVLATIADNDGAAVSITPTNLAVAEGGVTASYAISLTSEPTAAVYVNISPDGQLTTDMAVLTFTAANWDVAQMVQVTAVDDDVAEGNHVGLVLHSVASADPAFDDMPVASVLANIADNDGAAVSIAPTNLAVAEGGVTASYAISLTSEPTADVYVNISPDGQLTTDMAVLTFTAANWDVAQAVQVTAVDDALVEGDHSGLISHSASSADDNYDGLLVSGVLVDISDNDLSYSITADLSLVLEGDLGDSTPITITVQRSGGVTGTASTVDFALSGTATTAVDYGSVLPVGGQLSFAAGETSQQITLLVLGDEIDEVDESLIATLSNPTAPGTAVLAADTTTTVIVDDDGTPSLNVLAPATVDEGAGSATVTVTLSHASAQVVTVDMATSDGTATAGADYAPLTQTVNFPAGQTAVTLTVAIVDDGDVEPDETFHLNLSNPQNGVLGGVAQATVTIVDNDVPPAIPTIYLPMVLKAPDPNVRPDLVVSSVQVSANDLAIVITNVGGAAVTTSFWVDAFINPTTPPTAVNQSVAILGGTNIAWGIATPLAPGESITLHVGDGNQAPQYTTHSGPIPAAVPVYVHVDAFSEGTTYGGVLEQHELDGTPYNNISGPFSY